MIKENSYLNCSDSFFCFTFNALAGNTLIVNGLMYLNKVIKKSLMRLLSLSLVISFALFSNINASTDMFSNEMQENTNDILYDRLGELLVVYKAYQREDSVEPIKLFRLGKDRDGGYVVPDLALQDSDVLLSYGIDRDISFEESFSTKYNKSSYGFDCSVNQIKIKNPLVHFASECIGSSNFVYKHKNDVITSYVDQLRARNLISKKVFIKMDIEGAEYISLPEILKYKDEISGIVFELHIGNTEENIKEAINLLTALNEHFLLVHLHGNSGKCRSRFKAKNIAGSVVGYLELTYINKALVSKYEIVDTLVPSELDRPNSIFWSDNVFMIGEKEYNFDLKKHFETFECNFIIPFISREVINYIVVGSISSVMTFLAYKYYINHYKTLNYSPLPTEEGLGS